MSKVDDLHILVVDDIDVNQQMARDILEAAGYHVDTADDGAQAIRKCHEKKFNAVLMDIQMPVLDGLAATRKLRQEPGQFGHIPIIALTSLDTAQDRNNSIAAGMNAHLLKPIDATQLLSTLKDHIGHSLLEKSEAVHQYPDIPNLPGIDIKQSLVRTNQNWPLLKKVMLIFLDKTEQTFKQLQEALNAHDCQLARPLAHAMKGSAATIGAFTLSEVAAKMEKALRETSMNEAIEFMPELHQAYVQITQSLSVLRNEVIAPTASTTDSREVNYVAVKALINDIKHNIFADVYKIEAPLTELKRELENTKHNSALNAIMKEYNNFNLLAVNDLITALEQTMK